MKTCPSVNSRSVVFDSVDAEGMLQYNGPTISVPDSPLLPLPVESTQDTGNFISPSASPTPRKRSWYKESEQLISASENAQKTRRVSDCSRGSFHEPSPKRPDVALSIQPKKTGSRIHNPLDDIPESSDASLDASKMGTATFSPPLIPLPKVSRSERVHLSTEEKVELSRERNRVHAKNTRLRKKAAVDEMKQKLSELVAQRDSAKALDERQALIRKQNKDVRFLVIESFVKQLEGKANFGRWRALLKDDVSVLYPCQKDASPTEGADNVMEVGSGLILSLRALAEDDNLLVSYDCDRKSLLMDDSTAVVNITAKFHTPMGIKYMRGSFRATFCVHTNKIQSATFVLDTGVFLRKH